MALAAGTKLGSYEIITAIGAGGMGEVYKARDTRLHRDVAIKVLPDLFAADAERLARFEREAQVLASLNHPNIAIIHGLEESDGIRALVLELIEGPTLADRIAQGPVPLDEALRIVRQIAEALEAAHEQGIVHRDLKPSNIKLRPDGTVKVLDFGLAKALDPAPTPNDASRSPTMTSPAATRMGVILGTAAYMSPEQARGKAVDQRADIWAFGCVLYEMLTGKQVFAGDDVTDTLAFIITREPDWTLLPARAGAPVRRLLHRCLQKDPKRRLAHIADARLDIEEAQSSPAVDEPVAPSAPRRRQRLVWISAVAVLSVSAIAAMVWAFRPAPQPPEMRLEITTPPTTDPTSLAISPDGHKIVFVAPSNGRSHLWLRSLDSASARPLAGTEDGTSPFWSPDGRSVGFSSGNTLKRIDVEGRSVQTLASTGGGRGGAWNEHGTILFAPAVSGSIFRISATGGEPTAVTRLEAPHQTAHRFPQFLPDGRHFLYYVAGSPEARGIYVGQIDGPETRRLLDADAAAVYASSGHLLFVRQGTLFAQGFDPVEHVLTGDPAAVADQVATDWRGGVALSTSAAGPIIYRTGSAGGQRQFVWFDRSGKAVENVGEPDSPGRLGSSMSPDGGRVAVHRNVDGNVDVWVLESRRRVLRRLTFDVANEIYPIWSPDGGRIVFSSNRKGVYDLYETSAAATAGEKPLLLTAQAKVAQDWSPDGRFILFQMTDAKTGRDLWALPMDGDRKPFPVLQTTFDESFGQFSPDGQWMAFESNESGRLEVYIQPFPGPGGKVLISTSGGASVRWPRAGTEVFYIAPDDRLMAVPIRLASNGQALDAGTPVALFATHVGGRAQSGTDQLYMISADGQRFLMNTLLEELSTSPIIVILNWKTKS